MYLRMPTIFLGIKTPLSFLYHLVRCLSGSHNHNEDFEMRQVQVTKRDDEREPKFTQQRKKMQHKTSSNFVHNLDDPS